MRDLTFRAPELGDEAAIAEAQRTMASEGHTFAFGYTPGDDFARWVEIVNGRRVGRHLSPGWPAATFELALVETELAGRLSVRHGLNDFLLEQGGHIGYQVLPRFRRRGIGRQMLQRGLGLARAVGVERVMVTCDEHNAASRRIIESAGGLYESSYSGADGAVPIRRYWFA